MTQEEWGRAPEAHSDDRGAPEGETRQKVADTGFASTGNPRVDAVLAEVVAAADAPLDQQVAVFEQAHDELRAVLDSPEA